MAKSKDKRRVIVGDVIQAIKEAKSFMGKRKSPNLREDVDLTKIAQELYQRKEKVSSPAES